MGGGTKRTREGREDERAQDEVIALMHVLALCVTLGLKRGRRMFRWGSGHLWQDELPLAERHTEQLTSKEGEKKKKKKNTLSQSDKLYFQVLRLKFPASETAQRICFVVLCCCCTIPLGTDQSISLYAPCRRRAHMQQRTYLRRECCVCLKDAVGEELLVLWNVNPNFQRGYEVAPGENCAYQAKCPCHFQ